MEAELTKLDTVQICSSCGRKIRRGMSAVAMSGENSFFCNRDCLMRASGEIDREDDDFEDYD